MKKNYDHEKSTNDQVGECQKESAVTFESRDSIMAVLKKLLGKDKDLSDIKDLSQFVWP